MCVCVCVCGPYVGSQGKEVVCMCNQITGGPVYLKEIDFADVAIWLRGSLRVFVRVWPVP